MAEAKTLLSIVIPCYNEEDNIEPLFQRLKSILDKNLARYDFELIFINDGSKDKTLAVLRKLADKQPIVKAINLSRNFGKEVATSAGIMHAHGQAILIIDADGQHPPEMIPEFVKAWEDGAHVVTGVRTNNQKEGLVKRYGSKLFYGSFNRFTDAHLVPGSTDFRLISKEVQKEFKKLTERNRITRGLIDWLGFKQDYIHFSAGARTAGVAGYSVGKLFRLAINSFVSLSLAPLYFAVYAGLIVMPLSFLLGLSSIIEMAIGDPLGLHIRGSAYLIMLILFLVGVLLTSQGIIAIYLSHIHTETQNRPLYIVDRKNSHGIDFEHKA